MLCIYHANEKNKLNNNNHNPLKSQHLFTLARSRFNSTQQFYETVYANMRLPFYMLLTKQYNKICPIKFIKLSVFLPLDLGYGQHEVFMTF